MPPPPLLLLLNKSFYCEGTIFTRDLFWLLLSDTSRNSNANAILLRPVALCLAAIASGRHVPIGVHIN